MKAREIAETLTEIERKVLGVLEKAKGIDEIEKESGLSIDSVRRAVGWLYEKKCINKAEREGFGYRLTERGKKSLEEGLPEVRLVKYLGEEGKDIEEIKKKFKNEFNIGFGIAKKRNWIVLKKGENSKIIPTGLFEEEGKYYLEKELEEGKGSEELIARGMMEKIVGKEIIAEINDLGKEVLKNAPEKRKFELGGKVEELLIGKRHPYVRMLRDVRKLLVGMGFKEMESPLITQEFYNFDALFQPQNHPARTWTDTYQLCKPKKGSLPKKEIIENVKKAHETGFVKDSRGWGYEWDVEIAKKLMPAGHCTAHSSRQMVKGIEIPGKYFAISRCYRPDVVDATHLIEFNQLDGIIVGKDLNFRELLGMLKEFSREIAGAEKVRFYSDYYPFTEPSVQLSAKTEIGWVELGGAGIFRPELTESLGIKEPVLAWGLGLDRLIMAKLGIKDIRELFSQNLKYLRESKMVVFNAKD